MTYMNGEEITVLLVEDHQITRAGLQLTLEQFGGFRVVGEAVDGEDAIEKVRMLTPQVVLMDIGLPIMDGIEAARKIKAECPEVKVVMLSSHDRDVDVFAALAAGADGYCLKDITADQLALAVKSTAGGAGWLDPKIAKQVLSASADAGIKSIAGTSSEKEPKFSLSSRELEVLALLVEGLNNQQMAQRLFVSSETIKSHMRHIMEKLAVSDRTQAAVKAVREIFRDKQFGG